MKNTITITMPFSFKGVEHQPSALLDLDAFVKNNHTMDFIFHHVAKENNIDPYSYEYEVLESSPQVFSDPKGIASEFLENSQFDIDSFKEKLNKLIIVDELNAIAKDILNINDLQGHNDIKEALLKAYSIGEKAGKSNIAT